MQTEGQAVEYERRFSNLERGAEQFEKDRDDMKQILQDQGKRLVVLERCVWLVTGAVALAEILARLGALKALT